ncbi:precorrin-6A synthase (deacetylating) [Wenjunlia tyrosinilytica]|uniref:Precorrin-6A synthase (Deacetylating) n=1 Tax=Wenjunlia tyrosinilytica TaxID=1544741 RepID=A0A918E0V0_9ACTN|nr:precorrin-6A synthase (deacetylating) [Wenjunlia tyrosinilytica]GGO95724.1 precorrin-6A synthase (deacetylating) [Wenjunlia tyrosinilytica]
MKRLLVIGIGAGDPDHLTLQAVKALNRADAFFLLDKGEEKRDLVRLRRRILEEHARGPYRVIEARDPDRDRTAPAYTEAVDDWRGRRADVVEALVRDELGDSETGAFLVWGDPGLYDSTLPVLEEILGRGTVRFEYEVVPGISSVSALAARHRTGLTRVGRPLRITTGRRLAERLPEGAEDVVVMLDAQGAFMRAAREKDEKDNDLDIFWGAYLGTPDEILIAGPVREVAERILEARAEARERKGWIMDTYLLRSRARSPRRWSPRRWSPRRGSPDPGE